MWKFRRTRAEREATHRPDPPKGGPDARPKPSDDELLDRVAEQVTDRRLAVPAILFLESSKPLSFVGSQFLVFMEPFVKTFFATELYDRFAALMEDRDNYERLIQKIEAREAEAASRRKASKAGGDDDRRQKD